MNCALKGLMIVVVTMAAVFGGAAIYENSLERIDLDQQEMYKVE